VCRCDTTWVQTRHTVEEGYTLHSVSPRGIERKETPLLLPIVVIVVRFLRSGSSRL
jgi:hypothetical protein